MYINRYVGCCVKKSKVCIFMSMYIYCSPSQSLSLVFVCPANLISDHMLTKVKMCFLFVSIWVILNNVLVFGYIYSAEKKDSHLACHFHQNWTYIAAKLTTRGQCNIHPYKSSQPEWRINAKNPLKCSFIAFITTGKTLCYHFKHSRRNSQPWEVQRSEEE